MWLTFGFAVLIAVLVLYVPGYLAGRGLRLDRFVSVAVAPAFSVFALVVLGVAFFAVGITCSAWVLLLACVVLCLLVFAVCGSVRRAKGGTACSNPSALGDVRLQVALYVGVAVFVAALVFLHAMGDPASFSRNDDTTVHLSVVRGFLDSGTYSTLNVTKYLDLGEAGGYYPAAWHVVAAVVASFVGNEVALATNAMILVTCTVVLPLGVLCLMRALFPDNKLVVCGGSLFSAAFCGFPWGFVVYGQLLSNLFSFAMIPATLGVLICGLAGKGGLSKCAWIAAYACSLVAVALAQPNGAFTLGVWSVLFAVSYLWGREAGASRRGKAAAVVLLLVACGAWVALFLAPPLQSVVTYSWKSTLSIPKAVVSGLLFMFTSREGVQPFLTLLVLLGVAKTLKDKRLRWLSVAYAVALVFYVIDVSTDGFVKQLLTGFWYTDYYRTGAMTALFAIPLAALGFAWLVELGSQLVGRVRPACANGRRPLVIAVVVVVAALTACQFAPVHFAFGNTDVRPGLMKIHKEVSGRYSRNKGLTSEEDAFVKNVMSIAGHDCVINLPHDGSCWAYGVEGVNTYFRRAGTSGPAGLEEYTSLIRTRLCDYASSDEVRAAVEQAGAHYVMMLDDKSGDDRTVVNLRYKEEDWAGIESITPKTPGFSLVLSEGDMRLYRIGD